MIDSLIQRQNTGGNDIFSGINYFDSLPRVEENIQGGSPEVGRFRFYPRSGELSLIVDDPVMGTSVRTINLRLREPRDSVLPGYESAFNASVELLQRQGVLLPEGGGIKEVDDLVEGWEERIERGDTVPKDTFVDEGHGKWFVIARGSFPEREFTVLKFDKLVAADGFDVASNITGLPTPELGGQKLATIKRDFVHYVPITSQIERFAGQISYSDLLILPLKESEREIVSRYRTAVKPPNFLEGKTREQFALDMAFATLQFARWRSYELTEQRALMNGTYPMWSGKEHADSYAKCVSRIVHRFGEQECVQGIKEIFNDHLLNLHIPNTIDFVHVLHTNYYGFSASEVALGNEILEAQYPNAPKRFSDYGRVVNIVPLFGDPAFWESLNSNPGMHSIQKSLVSHLETLEERGVVLKGSTPHQKLYPLRIIRQFFPAAYSCIVPLMRNPVSEGYPWEDTK